VFSSCCPSQHSLSQQIIGDYQLKYDKLQQESGRVIPANILVEFVLKINEAVVSDFIKSYSS
jgi:hypothetical protein